MHRALQRQLKRALGVADEEAYRGLVAMAREAARRADLMPEVVSLLASFDVLMERVSASYESNDRDIELRTRSLDISSDELNTANARLRHELAIRREALASIRQTLAELASSSPPAERGDSDELGALTALLGRVVRERELEHAQLDRFKFALDQHAIVSITDVDGNILYANDRFCQINGFRRDELIGRNHRLVRSGRHSAMFYRELWETIASGAVWRGEICNRARDGSEYWVAATIVPFVDDAGTPYQHIGILTDITARKQAEEALIVARDAAQAADRAKSEFLATMSHELHTPMNGILGMTELALEVAADAEQRGYLEAAKASGKDLLGLLNGILEFARLDAGRDDSTRQSFDAAALVREVVDVAGARALAKGLALRSQIAPAAHYRVWGTPQALRTALDKLLDNALKFTETGEVTVSLDGTEFAPGRMELCFAVTDTGIGIPLDRQASIFEVFTQGDGSATRRYAGAGLGLATAHRLAKAMGGRLGVESAPGQGSRFELCLPADIDVSLPGATDPVPGMSSVRAGFDYGLALGRLDAEVADVVIPLFLAHCDEDMARLGTALARGDASVVAQEARALRDSLAAFGAEPASRLALGIEEAARTGNLLLVSDALAMFKAEVAAFCDALRGKS